MKVEEANEDITALNCEVLGVGGKWQVGLYYSENAELAGVVINGVSLIEVRYSS